MAGNSRFVIKKKIQLNFVLFFASSGGKVSTKFHRNHYKTKAAFRHLFSQP
jgi:hypothetical protein